jgi:ribulose-5-phosphate 4-epimerase/fuculose-1-phosphate aldolase
LPLHFAFYEARPAAAAVVHLHSTYATAISCLSDVDPDDALPAMTPYVVMRAGKVPVLPYTRPGSTEVEALVKGKASEHAGVLLANHGPVVASASLDAAVFAIEEIEEAAKLAIVTRGLAVRYLDAAQIADLKATFRS